MRIDGAAGYGEAILIASTATGVHAQGCEPWVASIIIVQGPGWAPVGRVLVKLREAVKGVLYYPALVDPRPESYLPALRAALSAYRANDLPAAFSALARVPTRDRDGRYLLLRAGLLLSVGRGAKAEADFAEGRAGRPQVGRGLPPCARSSRWCATRRGEALRLAETGAAWTPIPRSPQASRLVMPIRAALTSKGPGTCARATVELAPEDALLARDA